MNSNAIKLKYLFIFIFFTLISCEDPAPTDYTPSYVVQALLLVDEPIKGFQIFQTASLTDSFNVENTYYKNAEVKLSGEGQEFTLYWDEKSLSYNYQDTTYLVKSKTQYELKIKLSDGTEISGTTFTPAKFDWIEKPPVEIQYPKDTLSLPSSFKISWTKTDTIKYYILSIKALDTLEYGKYLLPPTDEKNRRILQNWNRDRDRYFRDITSWGFAPASELPGLWNFFKWYGQQELSVYAPDDNFLLWSLQVFSFSEMNPQLTSIKGAFGYFGSASLIRHQGFLLKNQP
ncbi:MAG: hypothetical protein A2X64_04070 [Ignavibacteria bacterium GWF2_33_9]|nr:MAG: hypothetical protein A2X64_04070 [Ignavibacteria bacterium GWF2_33_9]